MRLDQRSQVARNVMKMAFLSQDRNGGPLYRYSLAGLSWLEDGRPST
jgi:hypothetical protein